MEIEPYFDITLAGYAREVFEKLKREKRMNEMVIRYAFFGIENMDDESRKLMREFEEKEKHEFIISYGGENNECSSNIEDYYSMLDEFKRGIICVDFDVEGHFSGEMIFEIVPLLIKRYPWLKYSLTVPGDAEGIGESWKKLTEMFIKHYSTRLYCINMMLMGTWESGGYGTNRPDNEVLSNISNAINLTRETYKCPVGITVRETGTLDNINTFEEITYKRLEDYLRNKYSKPDYISFWALYVDSLHDFKYLKILLDYNKKNAIEEDHKIVEYNDEDDNNRDEDDNDDDDNLQIEYDDDDDDEEEKIDIENVEKELPLIMEYQEGQVYTKGMTVKYENKLYKAKWWTNTRPGSDKSWELVLANK